MPAPLAIADASSVSSACAGSVPQGVAESLDAADMPPIDDAEKGGGGANDGRGGGTNDDDGGGGGANDGGGGNPKVPDPDFADAGDGAPKADPVDAGARNGDPGPGRSNALPP